MRRLLGLKLLLSTLALLAAAPAGAANIEVAPVLHELPFGRQALSMTLGNRGSAPVTLQVRAFRWTQADGQDRLDPATDVIVAPAIFTLDAGRQQLVRARLPAGAGVAVESTFRLLIDELPAAGAAEHVRMALRVSVPVFVAPATPAPARLEWRLEPDRKTLVARNAGGAHACVRELALLADDGEQAAALSTASPYVLAGAERRWPVEALALAERTRLSVSARTDAGRVDVPLGR